MEMLCCDDLLERKSREDVEKGKKGLTARDEMLDERS
jgi:hypothetical protein